MWLINPRSAVAVKLEQDGAIITRCGNAAHGDFQCNNAMGLHKALKQAGFEGAFLLIVCCPTMFCFRAVSRPTFCCCVVEVIKTFEPLELSPYVGKNTASVGRYLHSGFFIILTLGLIHDNALLALALAVIYF